MDKLQRRPRLSLDLLKGFEAAARHLSFTRAAHELSLTQSAISREVKRLEQQLGQRLFDRIDRGIRLTPAGQALYRAVGEALKLIDEATNRLGTTAAVETLTVTTSAPLASMWLVPRLSRFTRQHPEVNVRCLAADQWLDLQRERIDAALRWAPPEKTVAGGERLFDVELFPVCAPGLPTRSRPLARAQDLARHVLIDLETVTGSGRWSDWGPWLEAKGLASLAPAGALRFSHYDQVIQAAIDGNGVAPGRTPHNSPHLADGRLVAPLGDEGVIAYGSFYFLPSPRAAERPIVKQFATWLREEVEGNAQASLPRHRRARGKR